VVPIDRYLAVIGSAGTIYTYGTYGEGPDTLLKRNGVHWTTWAYDADGSLVRFTGNGAALADDGVGR